MEHCHLMWATSKPMKQQYRSSNALPNRMQFMLSCLFVVFPEVGLGMFPFIKFLRRIG